MLKGFLGRLAGRREPEPPALRGRPAIRREKTYSAESGYVYQYTYEGFRDATRDGTHGRDFVFRCTSDRARHCSLAVFAPDRTFASWERDFGRELSEVERYAVVKMRLFEILDESARIRADRVELLAAEHVQRQVEALDL